MDKNLAEFTVFVLRCLTMEDSKEILAEADRAAAARRTDRKGLIAHFSEIDPAYAKALQEVIQRAEEALRDPGLGCETASE